MKKSAGILVYRRRNEKIEILLVHPGGPYWQNRDENSWSIPKGEIEDKDKIENEFMKKYHLADEEKSILLKTAIREFEEETGLRLNEEDIKRIFYLGEIKGPNKILSIFILEKDFGDNLEVRSNFAKIEWPPGSKKFILIPEVDKMKYFGLETAIRKLINYQKNIIEMLTKIKEEIT